MIYSNRLTNLIKFTRIGRNADSNVYFLKRAADGGEVGGTGGVWAFVSGETTVGYAPATLESTSPTDSDWYKSDIDDTLIGMWPSNRYWKKVALGKTSPNTLAIDESDNLWIWGQYNAYSPEFYNPEAVSVSPVGLGKTWKEVDCGATTFCAIDTDGQLYSWGYSAYGQLGQGSDVSLSSNPKLVSMPGVGIAWKKVSCDYNHTLAIDTDNKLWVWGRNDHGQLGKGEGVSSIYVPSSLTLMENGSEVLVKNVYAGPLSSYVIDIKNRIWFFGADVSSRHGLLYSSAFRFK